MAKISSYQFDESVNLDDYLIGTDAETGLKTRNYRISEILELGGWGPESSYVQTDATNQTVDGTKNFIGTLQYGGVDVATVNTVSPDSNRLGGQLPSYYLDWGNLDNIPETLLYENDNISLLNNDSGYITGIPDSYIEENDDVSLLNNDAGYITLDDIPDTSVSNLQQVTDQGNETTQDIYANNFVSAGMQNSVVVDAVNQQWVYDNFLGLDDDLDWNNLINVPTEVMMEGENISLLNNDAGYLTSEADTLDTVADRGNSTDQDLYANNFVSVGMQNAVVVDAINEQFLVDHYLPIGSHIPWEDIDNVPSAIMMEGENVSLLNNDAGYLTEEADTLDTVADRGNSTDQDLYANNFVSVGMQDSVVVDAINEQFLVDHYIPLGGDLPWADITGVPDEIIMEGEDISLLNNDAGYISGYIETDTLDTVADRGNSTNQDLYANNFVSTGMQDAIVADAVNAQWVTDNFLAIGGTAADSSLLGGQGPSYYRDYGNLQNIPDSIVHDTDGVSTLPNDAGYYNSYNFIAGTDYQTPISGGDLQGYGIAYYTEENTFTEPQTFEQSVTIMGNLLVQGSTVQIDSEITTTDAVLSMNDGEAGAGVTLGHAGLDIDRGSLPNFFFGFDETRDRFVVGKSNDISADLSSFLVMAARSDDSAWTDNYVPKWDSAQSKFQPSGVEIDDNDKVFADDFVITGAGDGEAGGNEATQAWVIANYYDKPYIDTLQSTLQGQIDNVDNYGYWNFLVNGVQKKQMDSHEGLDFRPGSKIGMNYVNGTITISNTRTDQDVKDLITESYINGLEVDAGTINNGLTVETSVPSGAVFTDTQLTDSQVRSKISTTATGLDYNNTSGVLSLSSEYIIPTTTAFNNKYEEDDNVSFGTGYFSGNVGIGASDPSYKLDVNGTGNFSGVLSGTSANFNSTGQFGDDVTVNATTYSEDFVITGSGDGEGGTIGDATQAWALAQFMQKIDNVPESINGVKNFTGTLNYGGNEVATQSYVGSQITAGLTGYATESWANGRFYSSGENASFGTLGLTGALTGTSATFSSSVTEYGAFLNTRYYNYARANISINNTSLTKVLSVVGTSLAESIEIFVVGTTSSVVIGTHIKITATHSGHLDVQVENGGYTALTVEARTDNNAIIDLYLQKTSGPDGSTAVDINVRSFNRRPIEFDSVVRAGTATVINLPGVAHQSIESSIHRRYKIFKDTTLTTSNLILAADPTIEIPSSTSNFINNFNNNVGVVFQNSDASGVGDFMQGRSSNSSTQFSVGYNGFGKFKKLTVDSRDITGSLIELSQAYQDVNYVSSIRFDFYGAFLSGQTQGTHGNFYKVGRPGAFSNHFFLDADDAFMGGFYSKSYNNIPVFNSDYIFKSAGDTFLNGLVQVGASANGTTGNANINSMFDEYIEIVSDTDPTYSQSTALIFHHRNTSTSSISYESQSSTSGNFYFRTDDFSNTAPILALSGIQATFSGKVYAGDNIQSSKNIACAQTGGNDTNTGVSLYGGATYTSVYGIQFMRTDTSGYSTLGYVSGDWATYFNMSDTSNRGWIFRTENGASRASISAGGNVYATGVIKAASDLIADGSAHISEDLNVTGSAYISGAQTTMPGHYYHSFYNSNNNYIHLYPNNISGTTPSTTEFRAYNGSSYDQLLVKGGQSLSWRNNTIYDAGNANKSDVAWTASQMTVNSSANDDVLIRLNSPRPWQFEQAGTGASTALRLRDTSGAKVFKISSVNKRDVALFNASEGNGTTFSIYNPATSDNTAVFEVSNKGDVTAGGIVYADDFVVTG